MSTTHSPAPWAIAGRYGLYKDEISDANGNSVATVRTRNTYPKAQIEDMYDIPEGQANARLIAAAPELLDALHHILNIEGACFGADESWNLDWHWAKVRAAIAKAEGR